MGQQLVTSQKQQQLSLLAQLQSSFIAEPHPLYLNSPFIQLLRHTSEPRHYVLRIKTSNNESEQSIIETQIRNRSLYKYSHLTNMQHYYQQVIEGYCGNLHNYYLLFYVGQHRTLKEEITKLRYFLQCEQQLLKGLQSLIHGLIEAKHNRIKHDNITTSSVYIIDQTLILADPEIAPHSPQQKQHYFSSQKLQCLRNEILQYDVYAADLFSIAMVILEASKGAKLQRIYKAKDMGINYQALVEEIDNCKFQNLKTQLQFLLLSNQYHRKQYFLELEQIHLKKLKKRQHKHIKGSNKILMLGRTKANNRKQQMVKKKIESSSDIDNPVSGLINQKKNEGFIHNNNNIKHNINGVHPSHIVARQQNISKGKNSNVPLPIQVAPSRTKISTKVNFQYQQYKQAIKMTFNTVQNLKLQDTKPNYHQSFFRQYSSANQPYNQRRQPFLHNLGLPISPVSQQLLKRETAKGIESIWPSRSKVNVEVQQFDRTLSLSKQLGNYYSKLFECGGGGKISNATYYQEEESSINQLANSNNQQIIINNQLDRKNHYNFQPSHQNHQRQTQTSHQSFDNHHTPVNQSQLVLETIHIRQLSEQLQNNINNLSKPSNNTSEGLNEFNPSSHLKNLERDLGKQEVEVNNSMQLKQSRKYSFQDILKINQIYGTQLQTVSNLQIPQQASSLQESFDSVVEKQKEQLQYFQEQYENGGLYKGYMSKNGNLKQRHGHGCFYYKEGGYYEGNWKNNKMNGFGRLYYDNGKIAYQGQWFMDEFHGRGKIFNDSPEPLLEDFDFKYFADIDQYWQFYEGDIAHDAKEGYGKLIFSNGQYYVGQFKNDLPAGRGHFYSSLRVIHGFWVNGSLIKQV